MNTTNQTVGQREKATQKRVVALFHSQLRYDYLGNWEDRPDNSNIEESLLKKYLIGRKYSDTLIARALDQLRTTANNYDESLYTNNKNVYGLLRYGIKVKDGVGKQSQTVELIDWLHPEKNDFAIAEEVTIHGNREKRPDVVLYVNGIALGVLELKRSTISIGDGIRQSIVNQQKEFIQSFFSTIQLVFAGNDTEGLRYGTIGTQEKYFLKWKEDEQDTSMVLLDKVFIDSLNEQELGKNLTIEKENPKGLDKLEAFLLAGGMRFNGMIEFLRNLQNLRSASVAHRKGENYEKIKKYFEIGEKDLSKVFDEILIKSVWVLNTLEDHFLKTEKAVL